MTAVAGLGVREALAIFAAAGFSRVTAVVATLAWVILPLALLAHARLVLPAGEQAVLALFLAVWAADSGAYLTGRAIGRTPLAPRISPKKTVEGLIGGLALALALVYSLRAWIHPALSAESAIVFALVASVLSVFGDLLESQLKRSAGIKDSGSLLPGHGGILDRIDGLLAAIPALYLLGLGKG